MKKIAGYFIIFILFEGMFSFFILIDKRDLTMFGFWPQLGFINAVIAAFYGFVLVLLYGIKLTIGK